MQMQKFDFDFDFDRDVVIVGNSSLFFFANVWCKIFAHQVSDDFLKKDIVQLIRTISASVQLFAIVH